MAGGPVMWEFLKIAQQIYEQHVELQLEDLQECVVIQEPIQPKNKDTIKDAAIETVKITLIYDLLIYYIWIFSEMKIQM